MVSNSPLVKQFIKKVEVVSRYNHNPEWSNVQLAFKRTNPLAKFSLFVSFKIPLLSKSTPKEMPPILKEALKRLLEPYFNRTSLTQIAKTLDKCSFVEQASFFDNTFGLLCGWFDKQFPITTFTEKRRIWTPLEGEEGQSTVVLEKLSLSKLEDSRTIFNYDPTKYVYNSTDMTHYSVYNVTSTFENWVSNGKYALSSGPALQISSVSVPLSSRILKSSMSQTLLKEGMHRELVISSKHKTISPPTGTISCRDIAIQLLSDGWFVDQYEVEEMARFSIGPNVTIYKDIDLEKPSYLSPSNIIVVSKANAWDSSETTFALPVHLRYQLPAAYTPYVNVHIYKPLVLTYCSPGKASPAVPDPQIISGLILGSYPMQLPSGHNIYIHSHSSEDLKLDLHVQWPIGRTEQAKTVSTATVAITIVMAFITIKIIISKAKERDLALIEALNAKGSSK